MTAEGLADAADAWRDLTHLPSKQVIMDIGHRRGGARVFTACAALVSPAAIDEDAPTCPQCLAGEARQRVALTVRASMPDLAAYDARMLNAAAGAADAAWTVDHPGERLLFSVRYRIAAAVLDALEIGRVAPERKIEP